MNTVEKANDELKEFIRRIPNFPKPGVNFRDIGPLLANPQALGEVTEIFNEYWKGRVDVIVGLDARGFIFASLLAQKMELPFVMFRKKGKLPGATISVEYTLEYGTATIEMQENAIKENDRVLIVDDLLATGGTALAASQLIKKSGGISSGCAFVVELEELEGSQKLEGLEIQSILRYDERVPIYAGDFIGTNKEGKLLLINRLNFPSGLALPGGKQDAGESLQEAIIREVKEETGFEITIEKQFGVYDTPGRDPRGNFISTVFVGEFYGTPQNEEGKTEVVMLTKEEILAKNPKGFAFDHFQILQDYFRSLES